MRVSSSLPSLCCPSCGFGFVEEIRNEPGLLLVSGTESRGDGDGNFRDISTSRSSPSGRGFLRRLFRSNRGSRQAPEGRPSLLQVLEIASLLQRSRQTEGGSDGGDEAGSRSSFGISLVSGADNDLSRILGGRGEDRSSAARIIPAEGSDLTLERPNDDMHAPRPLETLLQRLLAGILQSGRSGSLPASKAAIAAMPTFKIGKQSFGAEVCDGLDEPLHECAVCKEVFEVGGEVREMPCKHFYHSDCILPWLELHSSCPLCRQEMPVDEDERPSSSATSEGLMGMTGAAGGEPTIVFIGISGTGVLVFSFIMLGAGSRNETTITTNQEGEQGNQVSGEAEAAGEAGREGSESTVEILAGNDAVGSEFHQSDSFEAGQTVSSLSNNLEQVSDQGGTLSKGSETSRVITGHDDGNLHVEECCSGDLRDIGREMPRVEEEESGASSSSGVEPWRERRLCQLMGDSQADTSSGSRGRSFFSWFLRHVAARNAPSSVAEGSAESMSNCITARRDDSDENAA